jgi:hypothetical protein
MKEGGNGKVSKLDDYQAGPEIDKENRISHCAASAAGLGSGRFPEPKA